MSGSRVKAERRSSRAERLEALVERVRRIKAIAHHPANRIHLPRGDDLRTREGLVPSGTGDGWRQGPLRPELALSLSHEGGRAVGLMYSVDILDLDGTRVLRRHLSMTVNIPGKPEPGVEPNQDALLQSMPADLIGLFFDAGELLEAHAVLMEPRLYVAGDRKGWETPIVVHYLAEGVPS